MRYYELIYIVNSNVERKKIDQIMKDISSRLENTDSKIINHVVWGKKKLAYPINCLLYTSPSPRDTNPSRMPSSA